MVKSVTGSSNYKVSGKLTVNQVEAGGEVGSNGQVLTSNGTNTFWSINPGYAGSVGAQGYQGFQGVQGEIGPQGYQGVQGEIGPQGYQGVQGVIGAQGYQGVGLEPVEFHGGGNVPTNLTPGTVNQLFGYRLTIPPWAEGQYVTFTDLTSGSSLVYYGTLRIVFAGGFGYAFGITELISVSGSPAGGETTSADWVMSFAAAPQGYTGSQGNQGFQGVQGELGQQGPQGYQGVQGEIGPQGYQGVQGEIGPQGHQGYQGVIGAQGHQGYQGVIGAQGHQGYQGVIGAQGHQGYQGVQGTAGTSVSIIDSVADVNASYPGGGPNDPDGYLSYYYPSATTGNGVIDDASGDLWVFTGSIWDNVGQIVGPQGPQGPQGNTGPQGSQGVQGDIGSQGYQGVQGEIGPQGFQGFQGVQGVTGPQGFQGVQGEIGPQGYQGVQGELGPQGYQGAQGAIGAQGYQGQGFTFRGEWDSGTTYFPYDVVTYGGESYVCLTEVAGYQPYYTFAWTKIAAKGAQGVQGDVGPQGVQGSLGAQGFQGVQGDVGPQGVQGASATTITAADDTTTASLYPVMVNAAGTAASPKVTTTKLYFDASTGTMSATNFNSLSDVNMKTNIEPLIAAVEILNTINPVSFDWKDTGLKGYGVIAQEIEKILPELVHTNPDGRKTVSYDQIIPFLLSVAKDQQKELIAIRLLLNSLVNDNK